MTSKVLFWQTKYLKSLKCLLPEVRCNAMPAALARVFTQASTVDVHSLKKLLTVPPWCNELSWLSALKSIFFSTELDWRCSQAERDLCPAGSPWCWHRKYQEAQLNWTCEGMTKVAFSFLVENLRDTRCSSINKLCALGLWSLYANRAEIRLLIFCSFLHLLFPSYPSAPHKASSVASETVRSIPQSRDCSNTLNLIL